MNNEKQSSLAVLSPNGLDLLFLAAAAALLSRPDTSPDARQGDSTASNHGHPADNVAKIPERKGIDAVGLAVSS